MSTIRAAARPMSPYVSKCNFAQNVTSKCRNSPGYNAELFQYFLSVAGFPRFRYVSTTNGTGTALDSCDRRTMTSELLCGNADAGSNFVHLFQPEHPLLLDVSHPVQLTSMGIYVPMVMTEFMRTFSALFSILDPFSWILLILLIIIHKTKHKFYIREHHLSAILALSNFFLLRTIRSQMVSQVISDHIPKPAYQSIDDITKSIIDGKVKYTQAAPASDTNGRMIRTVTQGRGVQLARLGNEVLKDLDKRYIHLTSGQASVDLVHKSGVARQSDVESQLVVSLASESAYSRTPCRIRAHIAEIRIHNLIDSFLLRKNSNLTEGFNRAMLLLCDFRGTGDFTAILQRRYTKTRVCAKPRSAVRTAEPIRAQNLRSVFLCTGAGFVTASVAVVLEWFGVLKVCD